MKFKRYLAFALVFASLIGEMQLPVSASGFDGSQQAPSMSTWAQPYVTPMMNEGLIPASMLKDRSIKEPITREKFCELVTLYMKAAAKAPLSSGMEPFTDTDNPAVALAFNLGVVAGTSERTFSPNANATREQISTMIGRVESVLGTPKPFDKNVSKFKDGDKIADYAKPYVKQLSDTGAIAGMPDGTFHPQDNMTEEQAIKVLAVQAEKRGIVTISKPAAPVKEVTVQFPNDSMLQAMLEAQGAYKSIAFGARGFDAYYYAAKTNTTSPDFSVGLTKSGWLSIDVLSNMVDTPEYMKCLKILVGDEAQNLLAQAKALEAGAYVEKTFAGKLIGIGSTNGTNIELCWIKE